MKKYKLYAGLGGGFGGAQYQGIYEALNQEAAERMAYDLAVEQHQSYEGYHGILSYEDCYDDCKESGWLDDLTENEIEDVVSAHYLEMMESWLVYSAIECSDEDEDQEE